MYTWSSFEELFTTTDGKEFKGWDSKPVTGKVAIWNPYYTSQCFNLYKFVDVNKYVQSQFADIQDKISTDDGKNWMIDLRSDASESCKNDAQDAVRKIANRHVLLFVNGYRFALPENDDTKDEITINDEQDYWEGIDLRFINTLKDGNVYYADGHMSITTSNHRTISNFYCSAKKMISTFPESGKEAGLKYGDNLLCLSIKGAVLRYSIDHACDGAKLNTDPNSVGFLKRVGKGNLAGQNLLKAMNNNKTIFKNKDGNIVDTLDIVCHSMGYAYALGMIDALKGKVPFGRFYIIAPENASSGGSDNWSQFTEVWQYGSNENDTSGTPPDKQDGVAPQAKAQNLPEGHRVYIPTDGSVPRGFISSHSIGNYMWIFKQPKHTPNDNGYVTPR